jgi:hypothetical protein
MPLGFISLNPPCEEGLQTINLSVSPLSKATVYTQVESELVSIRAEWTQTVAARVLR